MQEANGSELGIPGRARARAAQRRADGPEEDPEHGACDVRVVVEEGPQPLWKAEHPLSHR